MTGEHAREPVPILFIRVCKSEARLGPCALPKQANVVLRVSSSARPSLAVITA